MTQPDNDVGFYKNLIQRLHALRSIRDCEFCAAAQQSKPLSDWIEEKSGFFRLDAQDTPVCSISRTRPARWSWAVDRDGYAICTGCESSLEDAKKEADTIASSLYWL